MSAGLAAARRTQGGKRMQVRVLIHQRSSKRAHLYESRQRFDPLEIGESSEHRPQYGDYPGRTNAFSPVRRGESLERKTVADPFGRLSLPNNGWQGGSRCN